MYKLKAQEKLILASASPRRKDLLENLGLIFSIKVADIDESSKSQENPQAMVERLALAKAESIVESGSSDWVLAADTMVFCNDKLLGKPSNRADAYSMLSELSGGVHQVWGAIALVNSSTKVKEIESSCTNVYMRDLSETEINAYLNTDEPYDKAGSYAIQGLGSTFVTKIEGSYTNVIGLSVTQVLELFTRVGILDYV